MKRLPGPLKYVVVGMVVLVVTFALWWGLSVALNLLIGPGYAPLVAVVVIVAAGWVANGLLLWRQARRTHKPPD